MSELKPWSPLYQWNNDWCQASLYTDDTLELRSGSGIFARLTAQETADFLKWIDERPTRPASPALDRLKELVDGPDGLNWIHAKLKDLYSAAHVDPNQISERMARDIVRAVHKGGDEILDEFARIKLGLSRALRIIEELKHE